LNTNPKSGEVDPMHFRLNSRNSLTSVSLGWV